MDLFGRLKELFLGNPDAEALIAQAEMEAMTGVFPDAQQVIVKEVRVALENDPVAPLSRNVTLRAAFDKEHKK